MKVFKAFRKYIYEIIGVHETHSSHDFLEGCSKKWLLIIIQHFIKEKWLTWETLENDLTTFPYRGRDSNSRPAILKSKKMKAKCSRKIIGCFAEISTLIRSFPQLFYNYIKVTEFQKEKSGEQRRGKDSLVRLFFGAMQ